MKGFKHGCPAEGGRTRSGSQAASISHSVCVSTSGSPEAVRRSTKAAIRRISDRTWAIPSFLSPHPPPSLASCGHHKANRNSFFAVLASISDALEEEEAKRDERGSLVLSSPPQQKK
ncbi:hypothetical protein EYF80_046701 [Liparis tanakae]|uniref:Uncharacterized protein n=1 Tax=Liparis tanakae TaxID=230148 RepID=A0A4Z2FPG5_9TELE|nr:hypothetical protein EYF80_046701 [Liparis tanakae]